MIAAIDIETIPDADAVKLLPEPEVKLGNLKDEVKIEAKKAEARAKQVEKAALDALTARVCCYAVVGHLVQGEGIQSYVEVIEEDSDDAERVLIQSIMRALGGDDKRIATWNGISFDLPMIYKRAIILDVDPANFKAPPLPAWTKRYSADKHYDLMKIWDGWAPGTFTSLETVARIVLGEHREDIPYKEVPGLLKTKEGRDLVAQGCLNHTDLTWKLWEHFNGRLFA